MGTAMTREIYSTVSWVSDAIALTCQGSFQADNNAMASLTHDTVE
jgi:hypothetical protein